MCGRQITGECRIRQPSEMSNLKVCMKEKWDTFFFSGLRLLSSVEDYHQQTNVKLKQLLSEFKSKEDLSLFWYILTDWFHSGSGRLSIIVGLTIIHSPSSQESVRAVRVLACLRKRDSYKNHGERSKD